MSQTIEKGITITFRGDTTKFDESVKQVNSELKSCKDELSLLNRELKLDPTNLDKLTKKLNTLKEKESLLTEEINAYQEAMKKLDPTSVAFKKAEEKCRDLEIQVKQTQKQIKEMGGSEVGIKLKALGDDFTKVGDKLSDLGKSFSAVSATAGALLGGIGALSLKTASYADDINTLSKQTGLSTKTLQAFGQMADLIDVDLKTMAKSAQYLAKNIDQKSAIESYEKLGISVRDTNGEYKDSESLLFEVITALQKVENETERSMIANDVLGKSYADLGSIINDASVDIYAINDAVKENGTILSEDELNALNEVNDNVDKLKQTLSSTGASIASDFAPVIVSITNKLVTLANNVKDFLGNLTGGQKEALVVLIGVVAGIAPILMTLGTVLTFVGTVLANVSAGMSVFNAVLSANPIGVVIIAIGALIAIIALLIIKWEDIKTAVSNAWEQFKQTEWVQNLIAWFDSLIEKIKSVIDWFKSLFEWIGSVIGKVKDFFSSGFEKIGNFVGGLFDSGGFGNLAYASGGYGTLELNTTINVNNNGQNLSKYQAQQFGREIVEYVNDKLGRRI